MRLAQCRPDNRVAGLDTTALVHEGFLRMADQQGLQGESRGQFFAHVGQVLRSVVIDHLRSTGREKRGGDAVMVTLSAAGDVAAVQSRAVDLIGPDQALQRLRAIDVGLYELIEMVGFAGLSIAEVATLRGLSTRTINRELLNARALLQELLGEGGMGQVWRAERADGLYQGEAAIKLRRGDLAGAGLAKRFERERALLGRLTHPGIARLLDAGEQDGSAFLVLEYVAGRTLSEHVRAQGLGLAERVRLLVGVARAVAHAHAQLIVHRDLKPSNVAVDDHGAPKLLDFGIAGLLGRFAEAEALREQPWARVQQVDQPPTTSASSSTSRSLSGFGSGARWACKGAGAQAQSGAGLDAQRAFATPDQPTCRPNPKGRGDLRGAAALPTRCGGCIPRLVGALPRPATLPGARLTQSPTGS